MFLRIRERIFIRLGREDDQKEKTANLTVFHRALVISASYPNPPSPLKSTPLRTFLLLTQVANTMNYRKSISKLLN